MKKIICIMLAIVMLVVLSGCQYATKHWGSTMTVNLDPNVKLVNVTWKEDSLWILTKAMTENDIAETYCFEEDSEFGMLEGTVIIVEHKE